MSPEYRLTELFISFQILPTLQISINKSSNIYPRHRVDCVLIKQKSALEDVFSHVKVNIIGWFLCKVGLLPIEKGLHLDATRANVLTTSLTVGVAEPSTKVDT